MLVLSSYSGRQMRRLVSCSFYLILFFMVAFVIEVITQRHTLVSATEVKCMALVRYRVFF